MQLHTRLRARDLEEFFAQVGKVFALLFVQYIPFLLHFFRKRIYVYNLKSQTRVGFNLFDLGNCGPESFYIYGSALISLVRFEKLFIRCVEELLCVIIRL